MPSSELKDLYSKLGQFYLDKNKGDYSRAIEEVRKLGITKIAFGVSKDNLPRIEITSTNVSRLIGKRGTEVDALFAYLGATIHLIEDNESPTEWMISHIMSQEDETETYTKQYDDRAMKELSDAMYNEQWSDHE